MFEAKRMFAIFVALTGVCVGAPASDNTRLIFEIAENSDRFHNKTVEVPGVLCEGLGLDGWRLQPGPSCEDGVGIYLRTDNNDQMHDIGDSVVVSGLFIDNTGPDGTGVRFLDYKNDGYWGNFAFG